MSCDEMQDESIPLDPERRKFLKTAGKATAALFLGACSPEAREQIFQKHFDELSGEDRVALILRIEKKYEEKFGKPFTVGVEPAVAGTLFGYGLDLSRCIGCRRCVHACVEENNQSRDPEIQYIRVLEMDKEKGVDIAHGNGYYDADLVPREGQFYLPISCQMCEDSPCEKVCPTGATWKEEDGIVVVDYDWCIGCRYCMAACPYGARKFNWTEPSIPADEVNTDTHYLGNRPRSKGVVEKCTFCIHRVRKGLYPACLEACPVGSRKFGNMLDPESEIRHIMEEKRTFVLKGELNTRPKFFYFYGA